MAAVTYYVALAFKKTEDDGGEIVACDPTGGTERRSSNPNGGLVSRRRKDIAEPSRSHGRATPELGDFEDALILKTVGEVDIGLLTV